MPEQAAKQVAELYKELAGCLTTCSTFAAGAYPQFEATLVTAYKNANGIIMGAQPAVASPPALQHFTWHAAIHHHLFFFLVQARLIWWSCPAQTQASTVMQM